MELQRSNNLLVSYSAVKCERAYSRVEKDQRDARDSHGVGGDNTIRRALDKSQAPCGQDRLSPAHHRMRHAHSHGLHYLLLQDLQV